jgi:YHS domain-containing protein
MVRIVVFTLLFLFVARAARSLWLGVLEGLRAPGTGPDVPARGVQMTRDPVCGTFVVPERAVSLSIGRDVLYFCSTACRDAYRTQRTSRTGRVEGRTA